MHSVHRLGVRDLGYRCSAEFAPFLFVLGSSGMLWDALEGSEMFWDALGCSGMLWDAMGWSESPLESTTNRRLRGWFGSLGSKNDSGPRLSGFETQETIQGPRISRS